VQQITYLKHIDRARLPTMLERLCVAGDANYNAWGLFDAHGNWVSGDVVQFPTTLEGRWRSHAHAEADTVIARDSRLPCRT
jgi:hypothetical protein